ncbi:hypothetical protein ACRAWD_12165 [Caulobacter segnis]
MSADVNPDPRRRPRGPGRPASAATPVGLCRSTSTCCPPWAWGSWEMIAHRTLWAAPWALLIVLLAARAASSPPCCPAPDPGFHLALSTLGDLRQLVDLRLSR